MGKKISILPLVKCWLVVFLGEWNVILMNRNDDQSYTMNFYFSNRPVQSGSVQSRLTCHDLLDAVSQMNTTFSIQSQ